MAKTILVVDDEAGYRNMIQFEFASDGYTVLAAAGGPEALEVLRKSKVDLVITDMRMTPMDGVFTMIAIRSLSPRMPIIVMTGYAIEERLQAALAMEASACLRKPFQIAELRGVVAAVLA